MTHLGLSPFFTGQLTVEELSSDSLVRVIEVQRTHVVASDGNLERHVTLAGAWYQRPVEQRPTVGDWILLDATGSSIVRVLERKSVFKRVGSGTRVDVQLIAANVDTLFIVTSCNDDCNESRLERYLALAIEAEVDPVIVLTKADLVADTQPFADRVDKIRPGVPIEAVNALDAESLQGLTSWVTPGSTVALVGSSGVGKSTLVNSLSGAQLAQTAAIREKDARGRHTTSYRSLHRIPGGGLLLDVPGMRELKLAQLDTSLGEVFGDIETLAQQCRFADCDHNAEPGCAVREAIHAGRLDERRLNNFRKLVREEARNTTSLAEQRHRERQFGKLIRQHIELKRGLGRKHRKD